MNREFDRQIAEMLGFSVTFNDGEYIEWDGREPRSLPHYSTDHAAAHLVEDEIERRGLAKFYIEALAAMLGITAHTLLEHGASALWCVLRATPAERCRAALTLTQEDGDGSR